MPTLSPPLVTETQTFYAPTLTHVLRPGLVTNTQTFYAPTVVQRALYATGGARGRRIDRQPRLQAALATLTQQRSKRALINHTVVERQRSDKRWKFYDSTQPQAVLAGVLSASQGANVSASATTPDAGSERGYRRLITEP